MITFLFFADSYFVLINLFNWSFDRLLITKIKKNIEKESESWPFLMVMMMVVLIRIMYFIYIARVYIKLPDGFVRYIKRDIVGSEKDLVKKTQAAWLSEYH